MRSAQTWLRIQTVLVTLTLCSAAVAARPDDGKRPRIFLIVCDCLTLDDLHLSANTNPSLADLARHGTLGLMNCAVAEPRSDTAAMLAIAAGQQVPAEASDEHAANDWEKAPGERISAADSHRMRLGLSSPPAYLFDPGHSVKHLGIQELKRRGLDTARLGAALAEAVPPVRTWIVGNADTAGWRRRAALLTVDRLGVGSGMVALRSYDATLPYGLTDSPQELVDYALQSDADFVVIQLGNGARAESARPHLADAEYLQAHERAIHTLDTLVALLRARLKHAAADILIVSPRPPAADMAHPNEWNRLTPILGFGPDFPPGTFASATTRTPSLVANTDIAPTILTLYHAPVPPAMIGRPMRIVPDGTDDPTGSRRLGRIARLDFLAWANSAALAPILVVLGFFCFGCVIFGSLAIRLQSGRAAGVFATGLICALNFTGAQLFAPILAKPGMLEYGLRIAAWMGALTVVSYGIARLFRVSLPVAACGLNLAAVLVDLITGQHLLKDALISNYYLPGFRYYGIGNDYLGLLLGCAIAGAFSFVDDREQRAQNSPQDASESGSEKAARDLRPMRLPERLLPAGTGDVSIREDVSVSPVAGLIPIIALFWAVTIFILGWPAWGANSGSLIVCSIAFGTGWRILRGGRGLLWTVVLSTIIGIALTFAFAYLDARLHGAQSGHAGAALQAAAGSRGAGYLLAIAKRKMLFNISLFAAPWTWVTASLIAGALLLAPMLAETEIQKTRERRRWLARSMTVISVASVAALVFKDSGVVTVCYLVGTVVLVGSYYLLSPNSPTWQWGPAERK